MLLMKKLYIKILSSFPVSIPLSPLGRINFVSLTLLLFVSPVLGVYWLLLVMLYFLFKGNYRNIFITWGIFFSTWYFFYIFFLSDFESPILIGGEHTGKILIHLCDKYSIHRAPWYTKPFEGFSLQTLLLLNFLSARLGFPIYIPSLIRVFI